MSLTRGALKANLRSLYQDKQVWRDSLLESWIAAGLRAYSLEFPRYTSVTISCVVGQRVYSLATAGLVLDQIIWLSRVEYPVGREPPRLLASMPEEWRAFYGGAYYDIRQASESLVIGETPVYGQQISVGYATYRTALVDDSTVVDCPESHLDFINLYVAWQAAEYVEVDGALSAERKAAVMGAAGINAYRAERAYRTYVRDLRAATARSLVTGPWQIDKWDRVY